MKKHVLRRFAVRGISLGTAMAILCIGLASCQADAPDTSGATEGSTGASYAETGSSADTNSTASQDGSTQGGSTVSTDKQGNTTAGKTNATTSTTSAVKTTSSNTTAGTSSPQTPTQPTQDITTKYDTKYLKFRGGIRNTYTKLTKDKKLTVVYIGGSITAGAGASDPATTSYRAKTTAWLRKNFPDATITEINKGYGSTGSRLPAYYLDTEVLPYHPDLVFIECAINDHEDGIPALDISIQYESIIRKLLSANPACDIVALYTTDDSVSADDYFWEAQVQDEVAGHYGITSIDIGRQLRVQAKLQEPQKGSTHTATWNKYFMDYVHPTDQGHNVYATIITTYLRNALLVDAASSPTGLTNKTLPQPINDTLLLTTKYEKTTNFDLSKSKNWKRASDTFERTENYIYTDTPDNELVYTFTGSRLCLLCSGIPWDSTQPLYQYSVDGGDWVSIPSFVGHPAPIVAYLPNGKHTIRIKAGGASAEKPFKVAAFLTN